MATSILAQHDVACNNNGTPAQTRPVLSRYHYLLSFITVPLVFLLVLGAFALSYVALWDDMLKIA